MPRKQVVRSKQRRYYQRSRVVNRYHPLDNVASPWYNAVVTFDWSLLRNGTNIFSIHNDFAPRIKQELGLLPSLDLYFRVLRADVYTGPEIINTHKNHFTFGPRNLLSKRVMTWIEAVGTPVEPASSHYIWPESLQQHIISSKDGAPLWFIAGQKGTRFIIRCHLMWKTVEYLDYRLDVNSCVEENDNSEPPFHAEKDACHSHDVSGHGGMSC